MKKKQEHKHEGIDELNVKYQKLVSKLYPIYKRICTAQVLLLVSAWFYAPFAVTQLGALREDTHGLTGGFLITHCLWNVVSAVSCEVIKNRMFLYFALVLEMLIQSCNLMQGHLAPYVFGPDHSGIVPIIKIPSGFLEYVPWILFSFTILTIIQEKDGITEELQRAQRRYQRLDHSIFSIPEYSSNCELIPEDLDLEMVQRARTASPARSQKSRRSHTPRAQVDNKLINIAKELGTKKLSRKDAEELATRFMNLKSWEEKHTHTVNFLLRRCTWSKGAEEHFKKRIQEIKVCAGASS